MAGPAASPPWLSGGPGEWVLAVWVQSGASCTGAAGEHGGCLRLKVAAPPIDGRANEAIRRYLADRLEVARAAVSIEQGAGARRKRVRVSADCTVSDLRVLAGG